jgi:hypothetical protein
MPCSAATLRRSYDESARMRQLLDDAEIETEVVGE